MPNACKHGTIPQASCSECATERDLAAYDRMIPAFEAMREALRDLTGTPILRIAEDDIPTIFACAWCATVSLVPEDEAIEDCKCKPLAEARAALALADKVSEAPELCYLCEDHATHHNDEGRPICGDCCPHDDEVKP